MQEIIRQWLQKEVSNWLFKQGNYELGSFVVEKTRTPEHGDWATNIAMVLAKSLKQNPLNIATSLREHLLANKIKSISAIEAVAPGFVNIYLNNDMRYAALEKALSEGNDYGLKKVGSSGRILIEFVSANPTGPLHVGHGRGAAFGASLANVLRAGGYEVDCEYYVNDAGRQMAILAVSVWLRYLNFDSFPINGYKGEYIHEISKKLFNKYGDRFVVNDAVVDATVCPDESEGGDKEAHIDDLIRRARELLGSDFEVIKKFTLDDVLSGICEDLKEFGVHFQRWFSEQSLFDGKQVDVILAELNKRGYIYEKDGAQWFASSRFDDEKDRVVVRENGEKTYFASDIAYHTDKFDRGYDQIINLWGADHHGYIKRMRAAMEALGQNNEQLKIILIQFAALYRGEEKIPMTTRGGQFVTLCELREEVGTEAARFFYVTLKPEQHLNFDLKLAVEKSYDNPIFYVLYAYARICALQRKSIDKNHDEFLCNWDLLVSNQERDLLNSIEYFPSRIEKCASQFDVHLLVHYLRDLAANLHSYYGTTVILTDDLALRTTRLTLLKGVQQVLRNGLHILGISARESM